MKITWIKSVPVSLLAAILIVAGLTACGASTGEEQAATQARAEAAQIDPEMVQAEQSFAFNLYRAISEHDVGKNRFISPAGIAMALAMTYNGADGETKEAMAEVLGYGELTMEHINRSQQALITVFEDIDPEVEVNLANSLWARKGLNLKPAFVSSNEDSYQARVTELDFDDPKAADTMNRWVADKTDGKIKDLIQPPIDSNTILFLLNAVYFKGGWTHPFDEERTTNRPFHLSDGHTVQVPMMTQSEEFAYLETDRMQAVQLPYGNKEEGSWVMTVVLPKADVPLEQLERQFSAMQWNEWNDQFQSTEGSLALPRFKLEYEILANDVLKAMGMEIAFDRNRANFGNMAPIPPNIFIGRVKHKSFIEVHEKGTEAAAATMVEMKDESAPADFFQMTVDRPFFFMITESRTGIPAFMGAVTDPS